MRRDPDCKLCRLHKTAEYVCLLGHGPEPCDVMIIGEAPGAREDDSGVAFVGRSGRYLREGLGSVGLDPDDLFITNAVSCRPPDNRTPTKAEIKSCNKWFQYQIVMVKPKFVLLLGNVPLQAITGKTGIKKARGKPFTQDGILYMPTFHPAYILRDENNSPFFESDLQVFSDIVKRGELPREEGLNYVIVDTEKKIRLMLADLSGTVSYDCETTGLYPFDPDGDVISLGLGTARTQWCIPLGHPESPWTPEECEEIIERIDEVIHDCFLVAQNAKFDTLWLLRRFGVRWNAFFDTMLAHYLIDENDRHGLKYLAVLYYGAPNWEIDKDDKKGAGPLGPHCFYLAHDLYYTRKLRFTLGRLLNKENDVKKLFFDLMMPVSNLFVDLENTGVAIDIDRLDSVEIELNDNIKAVDRKLEKYGKGVNWGSPQQVAKVLFDNLGLDVISMTKGGARSTAEGTLLRLDHECPRLIMERRGHKQQLSFFIEG